MVTQILETSATSNKSIFVCAGSYVSAAGLNLNDYSSALLLGKSRLSAQNNRLVGIADNELNNASEMRMWNKSDPVVRLALKSLNGLAEFSSISQSRKNKTSVLFGSSRGATTSIEMSYKKFFAGERTPANTSPLTTLGTLSSSVSRFLGTRGLSLSVSSACTTSLHAIGLGYELIRSGFCSDSVCGGSENSSSEFFLQALESAKILHHGTGPYQPFTPNRSGMCLGDGAAAVWLSEIKPNHACLAEIIGYGAATEDAGSTGISEDGKALVDAVNSCLVSAKMRPQDIDAIVAHGGGTKSGDRSELNAYSKIFAHCEHKPFITQNKWLHGHLLGAAGAASVLHACLILRDQNYYLPPFTQDLLQNNEEKVKNRREIKTVLVAGLGFGGNAGALLLRHHSG